MDFKCTLGNVLKILYCFTTLQRKCAALLLVQVRPWFILWLAATVFVLCRIPECKWHLATGAQTRDIHLVVDGIEAGSCFQHKQPAPVFVWNRIETTSTKGSLVQLFWSTPKCKMCSQLLKQITASGERVVFNQTKKCCVKTSRNAPLGYIYKPVFLFYHF